MKRLLSTHVYSLTLSITIIFTLAMLSSFTVKAPKNVEAVKKFELERYLGKCYEVGV